MKKVIIILDDDTYKEVKSLSKKSSELYPEGLLVEDLIKDWVNDKIWINPSEDVKCTIYLRKKE